MAMLMAVVLDFTKIVSKLLNTLRQEIGGIDDFPECTLYVVYAVCVWLFQGQVEDRLTQFLSPQNTRPILGNSFQSASNSFEQWELSIY